MKFMIKIWICLNLVLIAMIFALMELWHMSICILVFAIALLVGIALMKRIEEEKANSYSEMTNLANNTDAESTN